MANNTLWRRHCCRDPIDEKKNAKSKRNCCCLVHSQQIIKMQGTSLLLCFFDNWKIGLARKGTRLYIVEGHGKIVYSLFDSVLLDYTAILAGTNSLILWWHCFQHCHCLITVVNGLILPSTCLLVIILTADLYSFIFFSFIGELFCSTPSKLIKLHAGGLYILTELACLQCPISYRLGPDFGQDDDDDEDDERSI